ncbi:MAG: hypothetical protein ACR2FX_11885 [Chthoniobacterales bacterium]
MLAVTASLTGIKTAPPPVAVPIVTGPAMVPLPPKLPLLTCTRPVPVAERRLVSNDPSQRPRRTDPARPRDSFWLTIAPSYPR